METAEVTNELGKIRISDHVIAVNARNAALKVPGIAGMGESIFHSFSSVINDDITEGVHVGIKENTAVIDLYVCVRYGDRIPAIALRLQEAVKESIADYLGVKTSAVNVNVSEIIFDKEK